MSKRGDSDGDRGHGPSLWLRVVGRVRSFFSGDDGSIFWLVGVIIQTIREVISAVNAWLQARRSGAEVDERLRAEGLAVEGEVIDDE